MNSTSRETYERELDMLLTSPQLRQGRKLAYQYAHTYFIRLSSIIRPILEQNTSNLKLFRNSYPDCTRDIVHCVVNSLQGKNSQGDF